MRVANDSEGKTLSMLRLMERAASVWSSKSNATCSYLIPRVSIPALGIMRPYSAKAA